MVGAVKIVGYHASHFSIPKPDQVFGDFVLALPTRLADSSDHQRGRLLSNLRYVYVDESGTQDGSPVMSLAGYVFEEVQAARFSRDWAKDLNKIGIPFAHMTDCANSKKAYKNMTRAQLENSERLLIQQIKRRSKIGISVLIEPAQYEEVMGHDPLLPSAYSFCMMAFVNSVARWALRTKFHGKFVFVFEAGHSKQSEANDYMNSLKLALKVHEYHYHSHLFLSKNEAAPLQAADMLAWQCRHYFVRLKNGHSQPRKDFKALVRDKVDFFDFYQKDDLLRIKPLLKGLSDRRLDDPGSPLIIKWV